MPVKLIRKDLRSRFNPACWSLVVYYLLMNVVAVVFLIAVMAVQMILEAVSGSFDPIAAVSDVSMSVLGWGYVLTILIGGAILLLWKKPAYIRHELLAKGRPMTVGAFAGLLCVFLGVQLVTSLLNTVFEMILNAMGLSMMAALESSSGMQDGFVMFLYASILAPITEEILFRGLVQRTLMPYGKKFAIFCSAFLFGIFHGNLAQTPFAFMAGLVLGYVAAEYNLLWAMVLHMVNNLVIADMLSRLTASLPVSVADGIIGLVILLFGIAGVVIMIVKHKKVGAYLRQERMHRLCLQAFFSHPAVIILFVLTFLNGLLLFTPL